MFMTNMAQQPQQPQQAFQQQLQAAQMRVPNGAPGPAAPARMPTAGMGPQQVGGTLPPAPWMQRAGQPLGMMNFQMPQAGAQTGGMSGVLAQQMALAQQLREQGAAGAAQFQAQRQADADAKRAHEAALRQQELEAAQQGWIRRRTREPADGDGGDGGGDGGDGGGD